MSHTKLTAIISTVAQSGVKNYVSGLKAQGTMMAMIFEKSTRLTGTGETHLSACLCSKRAVKQVSPAAIAPANTGSQTIGQIVNYMSADSRQVLAPGGCTAFRSIPIETC